MGVSASAVARSAWLPVLLLSHAATGSTNCSLKALAVGPAVNSSKDFARLVKKHRDVLVGFSGSACARCCLWEPIYNESLGLLPGDVRWLRVDVDEPQLRALAANYDVGDLPAVVLFHERKPVQLLELQSRRSILALVERARKPLGALSRPLSQWFGSALNFSRQVARVAVLLPDEVDDDDLEEATAAARAFTSRPLAFEFARASASVRREAAVLTACGGLPLRAVVAAALFDGEFVEAGRGGGGSAAQVFNASAAAVPPRVACRGFDDDSSLEEWALHAALPPVGRFDPLTSALYEKTQRPLLMLFADLHRPELAAWLALLHSARSRYGPQLLFVYADGLQFQHRMAALGLAAEPQRLPALCFNFATARVLTWQPPRAAYADGSAELNAEVVDTLVQRYLRGEGETATQLEAAPPSARPVPKRDVKRGERRELPNLEGLSLEQRLRFVPALNMASFASTVFDAAADVAVYFYASEGAAARESAERAIAVNRCSERFEELSLTSVRVVRLDTSNFAPPPPVLVPEVPSVVLFPAFSKEPPYLVFRGKFKVQHLMWWIEDHASRSFTLPQLPHLDELEAKAYWEQKARLSEERQRSVAAANEQRPPRERTPRRGRRSAAGRLEL